MPDAIKQEVVRIVRALGAAALAMGAICAYAFIGAAKQCGADTGFAVVIMAWFFGFPIFLVAGGVGIWFGWRPRDRNSWAVFLVFCLLPALFAAIVPMPPSSCRMDF